ncbi:probable peptidyl-tRNA hydrolase 2 isoform X3 [Xenopus laevis]|uniref:peptidyl-tRNA hydrolase n=1 Tax=Xenopus laevis TaxID=8355 RepID=A0A8J1MYE2_XENLA|nr:probable peptidyl-tRNA hydrolase 2 isoform X3 [Xenopus laevis]XP_041446808.1 probable peptidyl-tRNA hydrolase 2 isoform X3 [Xenopus laevis]
MSVEEEELQQANEVVYPKEDFRRLQEELVPLVVWVTREMEDEQNSHKMVFVVNMELPMGVGKLFFPQIAAQVGHAAVGLYQVLIKESKTREMAYKWDEYGAKKVVLQGSTTAHLLELQALAISLNLPNYLVRDAGRTQIAAGSYTVLSIMGEAESVNVVTGKLKLLN